MQMKILSAGFTIFRQESLFLCAIILLLLLPLLLSATNTILPSPAAAATMTPGNETDRLALLAFRDQITSSPPGTFASWNDANGLCEWEGVTCSSNHTSRRVVALSLHERSLAGSLSPSLGNLTLLEELNLGGNSLRGSIPPELGSLAKLRILNLTANSFGGEIPANLSGCKELEIMDLGSNQLVGEIPIALGSLPELKELYLLVNNLTGRIPASVGNLTSLTRLAIGRNALEGSIPESIGLLTRLVFLQIAENQLSGAIPRSLYNLSSLTFIAIASNRLHGSLPANLGFAFRELETLYVGGNLLSGPIPASLVNASGIINLDFGYNNFTGSVPADLGKLGGLEWLNFEGNQLGNGDDTTTTDDLNSLITSLGNCTNLQVMDIDGNRFGGSLPSSIANLSTGLSMLIMSGNRIHGSMPDNLNRLAGLSVLRLEKNFLTGTIPASVGGLRNLQLLSLSTNRLSGRIQPSLGNLTRLNDLRLANNSIRGSIPPSLGNCRELQYLDLSQNKLDGAIPAQVIGIPSLSVFLSFAHNSLAGSLPVEVGRLKNLGELDISGNRLSGEIPRSIGGCESMEYLHLQGNRFRGSIPPTLSKLKGLRYLDLSFNDLEGLVPEEGVFENSSAISILGNTKLCGGIPSLQLPPCSIPSSKRNKQKRKKMVVIAVVCAASGSILLLLCLCSMLYCWKGSTKTHPPVASSLRTPHAMVSHKELFRATDGFSPANLIGEGSFGTVYRGTLDGYEKDVAVKVFNLEILGASKSFVAECEALRNVRHRNLVKVLTSCSSVDSEGNHFKSLVYEFMPNGSLEEWLHPDVEKRQHEPGLLSFLQRLDISIGVAFALDYLHHHCRPPIVHCDLKPSNVLLDEDMTSHLSDFGLAKILLSDTSSRFKISSMTIKGSIGYIPPEYGAGGALCTRGDVYSYGILVLEMFTGKRPTDDSFKDGLCLHDFVKMAYPERVMEVVDPLMPFQQAHKAAVSIGDENSTQNSRIRESLVSVIGIGLLCSTAAPSERMEMREVVWKMQSIRSTLAGEGKQEECQNKDRHSVW